MKIFLFIILSIMVGCDNNCGHYCAQNYFENITSYKVNPNKVTKEGFKVDTSNYDVDLGKLDERLLAIEKCLYETYISHPLLSEEEKEEGVCLSQDLQISQKIDRDCLVIKIVEPIYSKCSNWQFIKSCETCELAYADPQICIEKGIVPTEECPCVWRTGIQDNWTIITPSEIYLWDIVRVVTKCNNIWKLQYSKCTLY